MASNAVDTMLPLLPFSLSLDGPRPSPASRLSEIVAESASYDEKKFERVRRFPFGHLEKSCPDVKYGPRPEGAAAPR